MDTSYKKLIKKGWVSDNLLLVDKPEGITSFDIIRRLRKILNIKKMGHAGTLDPMATGLMIIGIEKPGTKQLATLLKKSKVYRAEILLGRSTDTGDREGNIIEEKQVDDVVERDVEDAIAKIVGTHTYAVPLYSAIKVDGKPLYWYAHNDTEPPRIPEKDMTVHAASMLDYYDRNDGTAMITVRFDVGSGAYIRTLAEKIGQTLGYPASLHSLRRTSIDEWSVEDAVSLDEVEKVI